MEENNPDSKVYGANMGPTWGRQDPGGPILAPWILLSGKSKSHIRISKIHETFKTMLQNNLSLNIHYQNLKIEIRREFFIISYINWHAYHYARHMFYRDIN